MGHTRLLSSSRLATNRSLWIISPTPRRRSLIVWKNSPNATSNGTRLTLTDPEVTQQIFAKTKPEAVIHFAGYKAVGSQWKAARLLREQFQHDLSIVRAMIAAGTKEIVFSSSATVYGDVELPLLEDEKHLDSLSPYGYTKVAGERILTDISNAYGF